jgi:hypothetical protein
MSGDISATRACRVGALEQAVYWMEALVGRIGAENVFVVSKVGHRGADMWTEVLRMSSFFRETGMLERNVYFVRERTGRNGKAPVVQELELTHFVDDHADVLQDIKRHFSTQRMAAPHLYIVPTMSWDEHFDRACQSDRDVSRAQSAATEYGLHFARNLAAIPLPRRWVPRPERIT